MEKVYKELKGTFVALFYAILIQIFLIQPFYVPSASMYPTLEVGDFLMTTKPSYGYSQYSVPFAFIPFKGRFFEGAPTRGEVVVFSGPAIEPPNILERLLNSPPHTNFIKRLVGMPGDRVQMKKGVLYINDEECKLEKITDYTLLDPRDPANIKVLSQYIETLPNGVKHKIIKDAPFGDGRLDDTNEFTVPDNHYFFMGDNRDHSEDSRASIGFIHKDNIIGPAKFIWFSTSAKWYQPLQWFTGLRLNRFFNGLGASTN